MGIDKPSVGRHVFGLATAFFGLVTYAWHDYDAWHQLAHLWASPGGPAFVYIAATAQVFGGIAIQFRQTIKIGALVLAAIYLVFALSWIPRIVLQPTIYDRWGNFFEQFAIVTGALLVYWSVSRSWSPERLSRAGRTLFGICVVSFFLEQAFYLKDTASLVPTWVPPNQMFWAVTTTAAFALTGIAMLTNTLALAATRLTTAMIVGFGLLLWLPMLVTHPHDHLTWGGNAENLAIAGAAWILADVLSSSSLVLVRDADATPVNAQ